VSAREAEVLALLGEHLTHTEIGARLFISARTVESHVASLRRKLGLADRAALLKLAAEHHRRLSGQRRAAVVPAPLSSFVGRTAERADLVRALAESRLVSAVGPGGVGKTRLALAVAAEVSDRFGGRTWCVDLVPVSDPAMVPIAVVATVGLAEPPGSSPEEILVAGLADHPALLVLDNCEHVVNAVAVLVERLLSACPSLRVLVTSRVRLVVPFEHVYAVPGLTMPGDDGDGDDQGDAVALFVERATAAGYDPLDARDRHRVAALCRALDGMALAIELAAGRLPALGLDGLEDGLVDRLALLSGGARVQERHRSVQDTLDWSYRLLGPVDQAVLGRVSVFAASVSVEAAATVVGFPPADHGQVAGALARLTDHNLLVALPGVTGTRYRALETVRQYGARQLAADEPEARTRHLRWCLSVAAELDNDEADDPDTWRAAVDALVDDLRAALGWSAPQPGCRGDAHRVALTLAALLFRRGRVGEAQQRYEQAARVAGGDLATATALGHAGAVAKCRTIGNDALELDRAAAGAALRAGDHVTAAVAFARAADFMVRFRGLFADLPPPQTREALLAAARSHAHGDPRADIAVLIAEANAGDLRDPVSAELAGRAADRARVVGDPQLESAALDALLVMNITRGDVIEAAAIGRRRVELLTPLRLDPATAFELKDALHMAVYTAIGAGDLASALGYATQQVCLPYLHEVPFATEELLAPAALAGAWDEVFPAAEQFRRGWRQAGRPRAPGRGMGPAAVAMVHGLRGDNAARAEWLAVAAAIRGVPDHLATQDTGYGETFDAIVLLHQDQPEQAFRRLGSEPDATQTFWYGQLFRQWHLALRAEAAILAERPDAADHLAGAALNMAGNPIATALVKRAEALLTGDHDALVATATGFEAANCHYQWARTLTLTSGHHRATGQAALTALGTQRLQKRDRTEACTRFH
jgi:predicted ATPase/DNA-binding CsgD family transcriptional regulator